MSQCQTCGGRAELFLCARHIEELRELLAGLVQRSMIVPDGGARTSAGWLELLADAANGQAKLGSNDGPRAKSDEQPLRINDKASRLLADAHETLSYWVRDLCETRRLRWIPVRSVEPGFVGPLRPGWRRLPAGYVATTQDLALWLATHAHALACSTTAGDALASMVTLTQRIEKLINRPIPPRFIGPCPTIIGDHRRECGIRLSAHREATTVRCPACGITHDVQELNIRLINQTAGLKYKLADIYRILSEAGEDVPPRSTFYDWCSKARKDQGPHRLKVRGYERPNGRTGINRHNEDDEPLYWVADVRKVLNSRRATKVG